MKRRDVWVIVVVVVLALGLLGYAKFGMSQTSGVKEGTPNGSLTLETVQPTVEPTAEPTVLPATEPTVQPAAAPTVQPAAAPTAELTAEPTPVAKKPVVAATEAPAVMNVAPRATLEPAESYLRVSSKSGAYSLIPLNTPGKFKLQQDGMENVIEVGVNSVKMYSSSCDNQDCVQQGEITLENRDTRILFDMIICLPNEVMLQLLNAEEARASEDSSVK